MSTTELPYTEYPTLIHDAVVALAAEIKGGNVYSAGTRAKLVEFATAIVATVQRESHIHAQSPREIIEITRLRDIVAGQDAAFLVRDADLLALRARVAQLERVREAAEGYVRARGHHLTTIALRAALDAAGEPE